MRELDGKKLTPQLGRITAVVSRGFAKIVLLALFAAALCARGAAKTDADFHYLDPAQVDLTILLPPPPDLGSAQEQEDEREVAATMQARNPSQLAGVKELWPRNVFFFSPSIGPNFTPAQLPLAAAFFERVDSDVEKLVDLAKQYWGRPRPNGAAKKDTSYPSGHAAFAAATAIVLARLVPCKRDEIFGQARTFAESRIILGKHFPSDVAAGWTAGTLAAFMMMRNAAFQRDFSAAQVEMQRFCPTHSSP